LILFDCCYMFRFIYCPKSKSKSKLCYDRRSVGQSVLVSNTHLGLTTRFCYCQAVAGLLMWGALSDERTGLPFATAAGPHQRSHSWLRPAGLVTIFYCLRFPQPGGPGLSIYILQKQGGPVIPPGNGFLFVASYDSQGYGVGIRTRLHLGYCLLGVIY
jgi:hypothetical protein